MAKKLTQQMMDQVAIDPTPNVTIGGMPDDELLALLEAESTGAADNDSDEVIEPSNPIEVIANDDIASLLGGLDLNLTADLPETSPVAAAPEIDSATLEQLVAAAESTEIAAASATVEVIAPGAVPTTAADGSDAMLISGESTHDILAELETVTAAEFTATPTEEVKTDKEKRERIPRKHYTNKVERLKDRVGADLAGVSMLTTADATLDPQEALDRTLALIKGMNKKEQNRASNLVEFITGKRASLNTVLDRVVRVLHKDGFLTSGDKGNVMSDLLAKPYSPSSARAMGANTIAVFADLMLVKADTKGRYVPNPDSVLLAICNQKMGLV